MTSGAWEPAVGFGGGNLAPPATPAASAIIVLLEVNVAPAPASATPVVPAGSLRAIVTNIGPVPLTIAPNQRLAFGEGLILQPDEVLISQANAGLWAIAEAAFSALYTAPAGRLSIQAETTPVAP